MGNHGFDRHPQAGLFLIITQFITLLVSSGCLFENLHCDIKAARLEADARLYRGRGRHNHDALNTLKEKVQISEMVLNMILEVIPEE